MDDLVHWSIMLGVTPLALDLAGRLVIGIADLVFWRKWQVPDEALTADAS